MKAILLILVCSLTFASFGQGGKLKKADNYFNHLSYAYAADIYVDLQGSEYDSPQMQGRLAFCYLKMSDWNKSAETYAGMINSSEATQVDYYNYSYVLRRLGDYPESDKWMKEYAEMASNDSRAQLYLENPNYKSEIEDIDPFFSLKNLEVNTEFSDFGGYYNQSEDRVYFLSSRKERAFVKNEWGWNESRFLDLFSAGIDSNGELVDAQQMNKVSTKFHEGPLAFSPDGKTVYFTRNNISSGKDRRDSDKIQNLKLYISTVDSDGKFIDEVEFPYNSKAYSIGHPSITKDGKTMYLTSDMPGGFGGADLYKVEIKEDGTFGEMINLGEGINTEGQEMFPFVSDDNKLFFSSDGRLGLGGLDVYVTEIDEEDGSIGNIQNLGLPINTKSDDFAFTLSKDMQVGYLSSDRAGGQGGDDIYSLTSLRPITVGVKIKGNTKDKDGNIVPFVDIDLIDEDGNVVKTVQSDEDGNYKVNADYDKNYTLLGSKEDYFDGTVDVSTVTDEPVVIADLILEKDPGLSLYVLVTDAKTGQPIEGVDVQLIDEITNGVKNLITPATGDFVEVLNDKQIGDEGSYTLNLKKALYIPETVKYSATFNEAKQHTIHVEMTKIADSDKEVVELYPIYFDLDKYNIRKDAKVELDKIVKLMKDNPDLVIEVGSHTDCRQTYEYNDRLATNRAKASMNYVKRRIKKPSRIYGQGYGEHRLVNGCECEGEVTSECSDSDHQMNRRTEFRIISGADNVVIINHSPNSFD